MLNTLLRSGDAGVLTEKTSPEVRCEDLPLVGRLLTGEAPLRPALLPDAVRPPVDNPLPLRAWGERGGLSALTRRFLGWNGVLISAGFAGWIGLVAGKVLADRNRAAGAAR